MRIIIVIDETIFYHPKFLNDLLTLLKKDKHKITLGVVTKLKQKNSIQRYLIKNIFKLKSREIIKLVLKAFSSYLLRPFDQIFNLNLTVKSVARSHYIDAFDIEYDINLPIYCKTIECLKPDLIISSCSLIFGKKILSIPKLSCINRHSSLLPSFGGLYPVLHAIADGKKYVGVTIHKMTRKIDIGDILAQKKIMLNSMNMAKIYEQCFDCSSVLIIKAIKNLILNKVVNSSERPSYNSFPTTQTWKKFRSRGGLFI